MKISLGVHENGASGKQLEERELKNLLAGCRRGDWEAKHQLTRSFTPLIKTLARKRAAGDENKAKALVVNGREGLLKAAARFRTSEGVSRFRLYALPYIEKHMDGTEKGGWLKRIFGRRS